MAKIFIPGTSPCLDMFALPVNMNCSLSFPYHDTLTERRGKKGKHIHANHLIHVMGDKPTLIIGLESTDRGIFVI